MCVHKGNKQLRQSSTKMRTRSNRLRLLDTLPSELLIHVLSHLQPQEMQAPRCSRGWRDMDLDELYWKPVFLNTFALDPRDAVQAARTNDSQPASREREALLAGRPLAVQAPRPASRQLHADVWRDRYERAWVWRCEPGRCAMGLILGESYERYDPRDFKPTPDYYAGTAIEVGVLSVRGVRGRERVLRYYVHEEAVDWGPEETDVDIWFRDVVDYGSDTRLSGVVVYSQDSTLYDSARPEVGRLGVRVGSPLRLLLEAYGLDLDDVEPYGDCRGGSDVTGSLFGLNGVDGLKIGLADSDEDDPRGEFCLFMEWPGCNPEGDEVPREMALDWPIQTIQTWTPSSYSPPESDEYESPDEPESD